MSTNPNNAVGTNAAYDGRTSVKAFNDGVGAYSRGIVSGWACSPNTGMTVSLGGDGSTRDIAIAQDNAGNKTTINNINESPISVTMSAAPSNNSRIDLIVAYVDNPPQGSSTSVDNPGACGLIKVDGTAAVVPVAPNESAIRTAITADGASGTTAYYVVLANVTIASGTTDLTSDNISAGESAEINSFNISTSALGDYSTSEVKTAYTWIDGSPIYQKTLNIAPLPNATTKQINHGISNLAVVIDMRGYGKDLYGQTINVPFVSLTESNSVYVLINSTAVTIGTGSNRSSFTEAYLTIWYTKSS